METFAEEETGLNLDMRRGRSGEEGLVMDWEWGLRKRRIKIRCSVSSSYVWADSGIMS